MALTAPAGLSTAQKDRLQRFDPTMGAVDGIPAAIGAKADTTTLISELASTSAGKGASCIGYEGGTTVQAQVAANTSAISALGGGGSTGFDAETATTGGKIELLEGTDNGVHKVTMQAPAALAADRIIAVPDADVTLADIATSKAAIDAAVASTGGGAGNVGKLVKLDGDGKLDGRDVGVDGTKLDTVATNADVTDLANVTTALGVTATAAVVTSAGGPDDGKLAKLNPSGLWDISMMPETVIRESTVALSAANILALHTTPIELVPAPAAGLYNEFLGSTVRASFGATALNDAAAQGNLRIKTGTSTQDLAIAEADGVVDVAAGTEVRHVKPAAPGATQDYEAQQESIVIDNDGGAFTDPGGADTTMSITTRYRILSLV